MAPDGAIPNSVVRIHFTPVMAAELVRSFVDERKSQHSKMLLLELIRRGKFMELGLFIFTHLAIL